MGPKRDETVAKKAKNVLATSNSSQPSSTNNQKKLDSNETAKVNINFFLN